MIQLHLFTSSKDAHTKDSAMDRNRKVDDDTDRDLQAPQAIGGRPRLRPLGRYKGIRLLSFRSPWKSYL